MGFANRNDLTGFRAVASEKDIDAATEVYAETAIVLQQTIEMKRAGMTLTNAQVRQKLAAAGMFDNIDAEIMALPRSHEMQILWEYSTIFERLNPVLVEFCTQSLNLTDEQIDQLFTT